MSEPDDQLREALKIMRDVGPYIDPRIPESAGAVEAFDAFLDRYDGVSAAPAPEEMVEWHCPVHGRVTAVEGGGDAWRCCAAADNPSGRCHKVVEVRRVVSAAPAPPEQAIADTSPPPGKRFMTSSTEVLGDALPAARGFTDEDVERAAAAIEAEADSAVSVEALARAVLAAVGPKGDTDSSA